jgi:hypothetical protein
MKLRFRDNSLRLRVNSLEVDKLAAGTVLEEKIEFPGGARILYSLGQSSAVLPEASFREGVIRVTAPDTQIANWAKSDLIGLYFDVPANGTVLRIAIEKDLECLEAPPEERDPAAFPRSDSGKTC